MKEKDKVLFLLKRWNNLLHGGAAQTIYNKSINEANAEEVVPKNIHCIIDTIGHINNIKQRIVDILPECHFIESEYNSSIELTDKDLMELYINHNKLCIEKVMKNINKNKVK